MDTKPTKKKKGFWRGLIKVVLVIILVLVTFIAGLYVQYALTKQSPWDYLPQKYQVYLQIPSLRTVIEDWLNLDAAQVVLRKTPELAGIEKALLDVKAMKLTEDGLMKELLGVEAHAVILNSGKPILVLDLGWRSIVTRWAPLLSGFFPVEGLSLVEKNGKSLFKYETGPNSAINILFQDNLAIVTFEEPVLWESLGLKKDNKSLSQKPKDEVTEKFSRSTGSSLRFLADPGSLISQGIPDPSLQVKLTQTLNWTKDALVGVELDNQKIKIKIEASVDSKDPLFKKLLEHQALPMAALRSLPESTYLLSSLNLGEFLDLGDAFSFFQGQDIRGLIKQADEFAKPLLGMDIKEFLLSWIGSEAGVAMIESSADPIVFLSIKDEGALTRSLEKLRTSLALTTDTSLVLDGVRVPRIAFPGFLQGLMNLFAVKLETPYYVTVDGVFYLSMNPEALAKLVNDSRKGKILSRSPDFQRLTEGLSMDPELFVYYDLDKALPFFLKGKGILPDILKLYNRGLVALHNRHGDLELQLYAQKVAKTTATLYPGFPLVIEDGISSQVWVTKVSGSNETKAYYVNSSSQLVSRSLSGGKAVRQAVEAGTEVIPGYWGDDVAAFSGKGTFYKWKPDGKWAEGFPALTALEGSFLPIRAGNRYLGFDGQNSQLNSVDEGGKITVLPTAFDTPLLSPPEFFDNRLIMAPKGFDGPVLVTDASGTVLSGWPQNGGGLSLSSPGVFEGRSGASVALLVQKGQLNLWDFNGQPRPGFPVILTGVYYASPVFPRLSNGERVIACLSQSGKLTFVQEDGKIRKEIPLAVNGKDARLTVFDVDRDGVDEIFVYGDKNTIEGLTMEGQSLPGFPLMASQKPWFVDMNIDSITEMVAGSYDGKIYAYTIRK